MMEDLIKKLKALAGKKTWFDNEESNPMDSSGGNFDACYSRGCDDGEVALARQMLPVIELVRHELEMQKLAAT